MSELRPVILSGGSGTRLWPLSTPELPKQFVPLFGGRSLFDLTVRRLDGIDGVGVPIVVTGSTHLGLVQQTLGTAGIGEREILVEPVGRNTAPAAVAAAMVAQPEDVLVIVPSDHLITDVGGFRKAVDAAAGLAGEGGIVTFGIEPTRPETGYGYIEIGESRGPNVFRVGAFKEKPDLATATAMVEDGRHVWNSGMFVARAGDLLEEARAHCLPIVDGVAKAIPDRRDGVLRLGDSFAEVEPDSIDYAIMEKTDRALVVPIDVGWDDVGSYQSLLDAVDRDQEGNHIEGDVTVTGVARSFIQATSRKVAVAGLSDIVVVETPDAVLVVPLGHSEDVRHLSRTVDHD